MSHRNGRATSLLAALCVLALLASTAVVALQPRPKITITAEFAQADGIHIGNHVSILGLKVGTVSSVQPKGPVVRIGMELPAETKIPDSAEAWIMSPAVISDRFIELSPVYRSGGALGDGAVIPAARSHAPVKWDQLMSSVDTLLKSLGPQGLNSEGGIGSLLHGAAQLLGGNGQQFRDAVQSIAQASGVLTDITADTGPLLDGLGKLVKVLADNKSTVDSLTGAVTQAASTFSAERKNITDAIQGLSTALTSVAAFVKDNKANLTGSLDNLARTTSELLTHQQQLGETLDLLPLLADNLDRAISPDHELRIRLNVTTNLMQLSVTQDLCRQFPIPLCSGPGLVNPIPFPPDFPDPLGLDKLLKGGGK